MLEKMEEKTIKNVLVSNTLATNPYLLNFRP